MTERRLRANFLEDNKDYYFGIVKGSEIFKPDFKLFKQEFPHGLDHIDTYKKMGAHGSIMNENKLRSHMIDQIIRLSQFNMPFFTVNNHLLNLETANLFLEYNNLINNFLDGPNPPDYESILVDRQDIMRTIESLADVSKEFILDKILCAYNAIGCDTSHHFTHAMRVASICVNLFDGPSSFQFINALIGDSKIRFMAVLVLSALLHDLEDHKFNSKGGVDTILEFFQLSDSEIYYIKKTIEFSSFSSRFLRMRLHMRGTDPLLSVLSQILSEADMIDNMQLPSIIAYSEFKTSVPYNHSDPYNVTRIRVEKIISTRFMGNGGYRNFFITPISLHLCDAALSSYRSHGFNMVDTSDWYDNETFKSFSSIKWEENSMFKRVDIYTAYSWASTYRNTISISLYVTKIDKTASRYNCLNIERGSKLFCESYLMQDMAFWFNKDWVLKFISSTSGHPCNIILYFDSKLIIFNNVSRLDLGIFYDKLNFSSNGFNDGVFYVDSNYYVEVSHLELDFQESLLKLKKNVECDKGISTVVHYASNYHKRSSKVAVSPLLSDDAIRGFMELSGFTTNGNIHYQNLMPMPKIYTHHADNVLRPTIKSLKMHISKLTINFLSLNGNTSDNVSTYLDLNVIHTQRGNLVERTKLSFRPFTDISLVTSNKIFSELKEVVAVNISDSMLANKVAQVIMEKMLSKKSSDFVVDLYAITEFGIIIESEMDN